MVAEVLETLPQRRFVDPSLKPTLTENGFLSEEFVELSQGVDSLFSLNAVLVVAPPWYGKTYLAKQLELHFRQENTNIVPERPFGKFYSVTFFETHGTGNIAPSWWDEWKTSKNRACWIVDAIDEDFRRGNRQVYDLLDLIESLTAQNRERLLLMLLSRENEVPQKLEQRLNEIYQHGETRLLRLAPLGEADACQLLGSRDKFEKVCELIKKNRLQAIASIPSVVQTLGRWTTEALVSDEGVWHRVLLDLLRDKRLEEEQALTVPPIEDRFRAASRIAAVLTFTGLDEIDAGLGLSRGPSLADLFPVSDYQSDRLRHAGQVVLKSGILQRTATGYRFTQSHVQEWFTAFELADLPLTRLRPLLVDNDGRPLNKHRGVLGLLHKTSQHPDVRTWIATSHHGLVPRSDAAPWTLQDATETIDGLQSLAKKTEYGLRFWGNKALENLATPGLGELLAKRISDRSYTLAERELLLDIALAISANETTQAAEKIIQDNREDGELRKSAAILLYRLGKNAQLLKLVSYVRTFEPSTHSERELVSYLLQAFYERKIWPLTKVVAKAPDAEEMVMDATSMLYSQLEAKMTLEDARNLLGQKELRQLLLGAGRATKTSRLLTHRGKQGLLRKSLRLLTDQQRLTGDDYKLLLPIALSDRDIASGFDWDSKVIKLFTKNQTARRELFSTGFQRDPNGTGSTSWIWLYVLRGDDVHWLVQLVKTEGAKSPWLWERLLSFVYAEQLDQKTKNEIRRLVRAFDPEIVSSFDARRQESLRRTKQWSQQTQTRTRKPKAEQEEITKLVGATIRTRRMKLHQKLHRLSWLCFSEEGMRPTNLVGEWGDLTDEIKKKVLNTCARALVECKPTPIPDGDSFPAAILFESGAFGKLQELSNTFQLTESMIRKWLPATLVLSTPTQAKVMAQCIETDRKATEDVILDAIKREMRSKGGFVISATNLPSEYWSSRLSELCTRLIDDANLNLDARSKLLRVLAKNSPAEVIETAKAWTRTTHGRQEVKRQKRTVGLDVLLAIAPYSAVPELARRFPKEGTEFLCALELLSGRTHGVDSEPWPGDLLESLGDLLYSAFPPKQDPEEDGGVVGPEDRLRQLRDRIPQILFERSNEEDKIALENLANRHLEIKLWYDFAVANRQASHILRHLTPSEKVTLEGGFVPVEKAIRLLNDTEYRLIKSNDDLQRVLLEELSEIGKDVQDHLSMLYAHRNTRESEERKRLHEDALQSYICCRLKDRLPRHVLDEGTSIAFLDRETLAGTSQKLDIKVQAPTIERQPATVVIEIKWSDNRDISTSLVEQLGEDYLLRNNLTRGVYLVGWNKPGIWRLRAGARPKDRNSPPAWLKALKRQAQEFVSKHPGIKIEPIVIDLRWN